MGLFLSGGIGFFDFSMRAAIKGGDRMAGVVYVSYAASSAAGHVADAVRYMLAPGPRLAAHLTIRGPYKRPLAASDLVEMNRRLAKMAFIVSGCGSFLDNAYTQNTVFLQVDAPKLRELWDKPGKGFTPHLTIYDGNSRHLALQVERAISEFSPAWIMAGSALEPVRLGEAASGRRLDSNVFDRVQGWPLGAEDMKAVERWDHDERVEALRKVLAWATKPSSVWCADGVEP